MKSPPCCSRPPQHVVPPGNSYNVLQYLQEFSRKLQPKYREINSNTPGKKEIAKAIKVFQDLLWPKQQSHNCPLCTKCFSTFLTPNRAGPAAPFPLGTEWPRADGPSSGLLTHPWIRNIPKMEDSLSAPATAQCCALCPFHEQLA